MITWAHVSVFSTGVPCVSQHFNAFKDNPNSEPV